MPNGQPDRPDTTALTPATRDLLDVLAAAVAGLCMDRTEVRLRWPRGNSIMSGPDAAARIHAAVVALDKEQSP